LRRAASEKLVWVLAVVLLLGVLAPGARAQQPAQLPAGIQEASSLSGSMRDQLEDYINANFEVLNSGTIAQQRAARDQLLEMFDAPSVSTAFRLAATDFLTPFLEDSISATNRWNRFAGYRLAARLASEDSARLFTEALNAGADLKKPDMLMAMGQLRVLFLEVDIGGLAISSSTLQKLAHLVGQSLAEIDDPDIALLQARALRALSQSVRPELNAARDAAAAALASAVAARLESGGAKPLGVGPRDVDELLVSLEAMDAIRGFLVSRSVTESMDPNVAADLARLSGQSLAFVTRTYEKTPPGADAARRYLQRLAQRGIEMASMLIASHNADHPNDEVPTGGLPGPDQIGAWLASGDMQNYKLGVIQTLDALAQAFGFNSGWAKID
jgi:hypothetical protein